MKQIVIRILAPQIPVYDVQTGCIDQNQGQFIPDSDIEDVLSCISEHAVDLVRFDSILGGQAFVTTDNLGFLIRSLVTNPLFQGMEFYPNFIVIKIKDHGTKKEESPR